MTVYINEQPEILSSDYKTLYDVLDQLGIKDSAVSVSLNDLMVPRDQWKLRELSEFDRIDFV
ncbi:MAG: sulfur carrier protein ThiS [Muribaculaceae bacterium]|nr:sulfur carrier protein ThiS [Muribaculaceae bacterium]MDE6796195.1 sulfur carrier protein ThiS [Muribaculaceae bacterium]